MNYYAYYKNKSGHATCESCIYFILENSYLNYEEEYENCGWCKRYPPKKSNRPYVTANDFCGEHKSESEDYPKIITEDFA